MAVIAVPLRMRISEFYRRLDELPRAETDAEAYRQVCDTLVAVEDELSGIPSDPTLPRNDGRMYPPLEDSVRPDKSGRTAVVRYRSKQHNTLIGNNGAIEIRRDDSHVEFSKPGLDGRTIGEL